jgi:hypothetical protein
MADRGVECLSNPTTRRGAKHLNSGIMLRANFAWLIQPDARRKATMKIPIKKKLIIASLIILILSGFLFLMCMFHSLSCSIAPRAHSICEIIYAYSKLNSGSFPKSEYDLEQANLITRTRTPDGIKYQYRFNVDQPWSTTDLRITRFNIAYGTDIESLKLSDGRLYNTETGQEVLLIDGPYKRALDNTYRTFSVGLYNRIVEERQKAKDALK